MKKTIKAFTATAALSIALFANAIAQKLNSHEVALNAQSFENVEKIKSTYAKTDLSNVNSKAVQNFNKKYKNTSNCTWYIEANGNTMVYFLKDNIRNYVSYNSKGYWKYTMKKFNEEKLPIYVKNLVHENFSDFEIKSITEVEKLEAKVYFINLEGMNIWKNIKVFENGEIEIVKEFKKSK